MTDRYDEEARRLVYALTETSALTPSSADAARISVKATRRLILDALRRVAAEERAAGYRAGQERMAAVAKEALEDVAEYIDAHIAEATGLALARLEDVDVIVCDGLATIRALPIEDEPTGGAET